MPNTLSNYPDSVVYNLKTGFSREPSSPRRCPFCQSELMQQDVQQSVVAAESLEDERLIPVYFGAWRFSCPSCSWWCVRELWCLYELPFGTIDQLVTGVLRRWDVTLWLSQLPQITSDFRAHLSQKPINFTDTSKFAEALSMHLTFLNPINQCRFVGSGKNDKSDFHLFLISTQNTQWLLLVKKTIRGFIDIEVVEMINGLFINDGAMKNALLTTKRPVIKAGKTPKIMTRQYIVSIPPECLEQFVPLIPDKPAPSWDELSLRTDLYEDEQQIPAVISDVFNSGRST
jgi:hypothetical protein